MNSREVSEGSRGAASDGPARGHRVWRTRGPLRAFAAAPGVALVGVLLGLGCGLLDEATTLTLCADPQRFTVDTAQLGLSGAVATLPALPCASTPNVCTQLAAAFSCSAEVWQCSAQCTPRTEGGAVCGLRAVLTQHVDIDVAAHLRNQLQARLLDRVSLDRVSYAVSENTLTVATPELRLYVGPTTANAVSDAGVVLLARLPPIAAATTVASTALPMEAEGQRRLAELVKNYRTPFRVLAAAELVFVGGQPAPSGALAIELKPCFKADVL